MSKPMNTARVDVWFRVFGGDYVGGEPWQSNKVETFDVHYFPDTTIPLRDFCMSVVCHELHKRYGPMRDETDREAENWEDYNIIWVHWPDSLTEATD